MPNLPKLRITWESDLQIPLSECDWINILQHIPRISRNARLKYLQFNYTHRTYMSPARLHSIFPSVSPRCLRCGDEDADFYHMVWKCSVLVPFWEEICGYLTWITGRAHLLTPRACLLGLYPRPKKSKASSKLIDLAFALAKRTIAMHWRSQDAPSITEWKHHLRRWAHLEDMIIRKQMFQAGQTLSISAWDALIIALEPHSDDRPP